MYLSRMELNLNIRKTLHLISNPNFIHGLVEQSFLGERKRNLWRVDVLHGRQYLMILSSEKPDLTKAVDTYGYSEKGWETLDYSPLLDRIIDNSRWHFRLVANPTKSIPRKRDATGKSSRGKVVAHITEFYQRQWLMEHSEKNGFSLTDDSFIVANTQWKIFNKGDHRVTLLSVTYEGELTVSSPELFRKALVNGIGREKSYGMGMLTVVKC